MKADDELRLSEQISAYLDGELNDVERAEVESLLATSDFARRRLAEFRRMAGMLGSLPRGTAPPDLAESLTAQLERDEILADASEVLAGHPPAVRRLGPWLATAAAILVTVSAGYLTFSYLRPSATGIRPADVGPVADAGRPEPESTRRGVTLDKAYAPRRASADDAKKEEAGRQLSDESDAVRARRGDISENTSLMRDDYAAATPPAQPTQAEEKDFSFGDRGLKVSAKSADQSLESKDVRLTVELALSEGVRGGGDQPTMGAAPTIAKAGTAGAGLQSATLTDVDQAAGVAESESRHDAGAVVSNVARDSVESVGPTIELVYADAAARDKALTLFCDEMQRTSPATARWFYSAKRVDGERAQIDDLDQTMAANDWVVLLDGDGRSLSEAERVLNSVVPKSAPLTVVVNEPAATLGFRGLQDLTWDDRRAYALGAGPHSASAAPTAVSAAPAGAGTIAAKQGGPATWALEGHAAVQQVQTPAASAAVQPWVATVAPAALAGPPSDEEDEVRLEALRSLGYLAGARTAGRSAAATRSAKAKVAQAAPAARPDVSQAGAQSIAPAAARQTVTSMPVSQPAGGDEAGRRLRVVFAARLPKAPPPAASQPATMPAATQPCASRSAPAP